MTEKKPATGIFIKHFHKVALILLCIMLFFAYCNTFYSPPTLDDFHSFIHEPLVKIQNWSAGSLLLLSQTKFGLKRWIPMITFSWDIKMSNGELFSLHLTNLLIHFASFLAVFFCAYQIMVYPRQASQAERCLPPPRAAAIWVAGLWALHPAQTNAVTYIVQRMASLVALFSLLSVAFYVAARARSVNRIRYDARALLLYLCCLITMAMAFVSKENSAILPILLVCTEIWFFQKDLLGHFLKIVRTHYFLSTAAILVAVAVLAVNLPQFLVGYEGRHFTLGQRLLTESRVVIWYLSSLIWPHPSRFSLEHDVELSTSLVHPLSTLFAVLFWCVLIGWIMVRRRKYPLVTYGLLWFILNLVIESTIIPLELVFEHRMYLSSLGLILSLVLMLYSTLRFLLPKVSSKDFGTLSWCAFAIFASLLTLATFERNQAWQDVVTLNRDNVAKAPNNPRAHANLAVALSRTGIYEEAINEAHIAIGAGQENFESYCEAANTIILSHYGLKEYQLAVSEGERLIAERPDHSGASALPLMCLSTALAYQELGDLQSAYRTVLKGLYFNQHLSARSPMMAELCIKVLQTLMQQAILNGLELSRDENSMRDIVPVNTEIVPINTQIAKILLHFDHRTEARSLLEFSLEESPTNLETQQILGGLARDDALSKLQQQKGSFMQKYVEQPFSRFNLYLAGAYLVRAKKLPAPFAKLGEALLDDALKIQPDSADAHLLKAWYHYQRDESSPAVARAKRALELDPDYAKAWLGLGFFLAKANQPEEAVAAFQKNLQLFPVNPDRLAIVDILAGLAGQLAEPGQ
jgi:protein O-mannosyl-transferase